MLKECLFSDLYLHAIMTNWEVVITFIYPHEAHLAKGVLETEGVEVVIADELTAQVNNFYSTAIGGVKLFVRKDEKERAYHILKEAGFINEPEPKEEVTLAVFSKAHTATCPYCHSDNVSKKKTPGYIVLLSFLLLNIPLPFMKKTYHCFDCLKEWKIK